MPLSEPSASTSESYTLTRLPTGRLRHCRLGFKGIVEDEVAGAIRVGGTIRGLAVPQLGAAGRAGRVVGERVGAVLVGRRVFRDRSEGRGAVAREVSSCGFDVSSHGAIERKHVPAAV